MYFFVLFYVFLCFSMYCLFCVVCIVCVFVCHRVAIQFQLNIYMVLFLFDKVIYVFLLL